jgi:RNA polymerase sigma-70 factor (ECF subfamily)
MSPLSLATVRADARLTPSRVAKCDEDLVADVCAGREGSFELLVRRHQSGVYAFLCRMVRSPEEAADLAQEVFLKVFANIEQFNSIYRFKTWLYRIAANAAVDRRRRNRHAASRSTLPDEDGNFSLIASVDPGPDDLLQEKETRARLEAALNRMPGTYREVLLLRFQGDLRYDEIAVITGLPLGTVKNRIFRAREMLKKALR